MHAKRGQRRAAVTAPSNVQSKSSPVARRLSEGAAALTAPRRRPLEPEAGDEAEPVCWLRRGRPPPPSHRRRSHCAALPILHSPPRADPKLEPQLRRHGRLSEAQPQLHPTAKDLSKQPALYQQLSRTVGARAVRWSGLMSGCVSVTNEQTTAILATSKAAAF
jgi:hypothetical protein